MSLKNLSDLDLISKTKMLIREEKRILQSILESLCEIERRRLYALRGYSSLFEFCVKELNYSESAAFRRISSMRLIKTLPEAKESLNLGVVNLSTLSQLQGFIKKEETLKQTKLDHKEKLSLLKVIENKSQKECEREFIRISPEIIKTRESIREITEDTVEYKFMASKDLEEKLTELKNLLAHQNKTNSTQELIEILADMALKQLRPKEKPFQQKSTSAAEVKESSSSENGMQTKLISLAEIRRQVWVRDGGECQYEDSLTKKACKSKYKIQVDHIHPKALGGGDELQNLRLLCATHNQLAAIRVFSHKHMRNFITGLR